MEIVSFIVYNRVLCQILSLKNNISTKFIQGRLEWNPVNFNFFKNTMLFQL